MFRHYTSLVTPEELVLKQFPGRLYITLVEAGAAIGMRPQTCYNLRTRGTFPLPVRMVGDRPMVALTDLVDYMRNKAAQPIKRRRGRPSARDRELP